MSDSTPTKLRETVTDAPATPGIDSDIIHLTQDQKTLEQPVNRSNTNGHATNGVAKVKNPFADDVVALNHAQENFTATTSLEATAPGQLKVILRNGSVVLYDSNKVAVAMTKAFLKVQGANAAVSSSIHEKVAKLTKAVTESLTEEWPVGGAVHIESIQDRVESKLMHAEEFDVARRYILYREERRQLREQQQPQTITTPVEPTPATKKTSRITVTLADGKKVPLDSEQLNTIVNEACQNLGDVDAQMIVDETLRNLYNEIPLADVFDALVLCARAMIETSPNYSFVSARLLLHNLRNEALTFLGLAPVATQAEMQQCYSAALEKYITRGIALNRLDKRLQHFDLEKLGKAIKGERDYAFTYLGLQTLYDRYFIHENDVRYELPQIFFMRIAMGLALAERADKNNRAIEFYHLLSSLDYMCSTPTLFNAGTIRPQLSSCFLTTVSDDLDSIYSAIKDNALLSKFAGGLGNDWTPVRGMGARIHGTNGKSQGVVPFMNVADATAIAVNQGGKRKGAVCAYLETWHMDIEEFLELRKNTGDDRRRTHDMNTANWVPDLFLKRVFQNQDWSLFSPDEAPDLHDLYGAEFEQAYVAYEAKATKGEIRTKKIPAVTLWRKMLSMLFETGHPWITFKDVCNIRSPQQHAGVVHSSNLCTEITLNTSKDEIAVCNLGSINLPNHINENGLDQEKLKRTIKTAVRMLDNVLEVNYYTVPQARRSNLRHRPVGLGLMGFQDALYKLNISYASDEAVTFADQSMEAISYYAIEASSLLAEERGSYQSYEGSTWSKGILPIDTIEQLQDIRGQYLEQDQTQTMDWDKLRTQVATMGMRNSNVMAIAPTATIANICGVSQSIEPTYQNLYVKSNMSGEFTVVNPYLVADLKALDLWDEVMVNDLKYYNGSIQKIDRIPVEIKSRYLTAFELEPKWLVEAGSRRQKWIDQAQSLNLYMAEPSGKKLDILYRMAWIRGLKTTYYLRSLGATNTEKSTLVRDGSLNAVNIDAPKACAIDDPDCEACQ